ncbi:MAG: methyltransferase domain-containing protein, partial [candidate division Zixibacteria bacterium]|nr:methyltransferase domain-containing protein [candidate division Zixibacteria bacterium]
AEAYARLGFTNTYYLAYRDLPEIYRKHAHGRRAMDFGCGTGRSTRFLKDLGFDAVGADISEEMIRLARQADPAGDYRLIPDDDFSSWAGQHFDLITSIFTFDNIPTMAKKVAIFRDLHNLLNPKGRIVSLVSAPEIYIHEWASFSSKDYPENRRAKSGDPVKIIVTDHADSRPVEDIVWSDADYRAVYASAGLKSIEVCRPLAREDEPYPWVNETRIAPWVIYVLAPIEE